MRLALATSLLAVSLVSSCLDPTEIIIEVSTNVACSVVLANGVAIIVGAPGADDGGINTVTMMCSPDGDVGTLVVTPSGSAEDEVGVRVMLGIGTPVEQCQAPNFDDCIVARRAIRYTPHHPLELPILLDQACIGVSCDPSSTCVGGFCQDAGGNDCDGGVCNVPPACISTPAPVLVGPSAGLATPHVARTPRGYAVTWMSGSTIELLTVGQDGKPIDQTATSQSIADGGFVGPLAGNPVGYGYVYADALGLHAVRRLYDGGGTTDTQMTGFTPVSRVIYDAVAHAYVSTVQNPIAFYSWNAAGASELLGAPPATNASSLAYDGTTYYVAADVVPDAGAVYACAIFPCTLAGSAMSCGSQLDGRQNCQDAHLGVRDGKNYVFSYYDSTQPNNDTLVVQTVSAGVAAPPDHGMVDSLTSHVALATGTAPYRVVFVQSDQLKVDTFPHTSTNLPTILTGALGFTAQGGSQAGPGFDAVADESKSSNGYAVVYWMGGATGGAIYFSHQCD